MLNSPRARAEDVRALASAIVLGSGAGLVIGAAYLAGSGGHGAPQTPAAPAQMGQAVALSSPPAAKSPSPANTSPSSTAKSPPPVVIKAAAGPAPTGFAKLLRDRFHLAGPLTQAAARPFQFQQVAAAQNDENCLAEAVYFEARGESDAGQQAVAQVVLNRVRHPAFPKTVCGVVHQRSSVSCQFAFACTTQRPAMASVAWRRAEEVASSALHGAVMAAVGDATHFQSARGGAFAGLMKVAQVGAHVFYRFAGHAGAPEMFRQTPAPSATVGAVQLASNDRTPPATETAPTASPPGPIHVRIEVAAPVAAKPPAPKVAAAPAAPSASAAPLHLVAAETAEARPATNHAAPAPAASTTADVSATKPVVTTVALAS